MQVCRLKLYYHPYYVLMLLRQKELLYCWLLIVGMVQQVKMFLKTDTQMGFYQLFYQLFVAKIECVMQIYNLILVPTESKCSLKSLGSLMHDETLFPVFLFCCCIYCVLSFIMAKFISCSKCCNAEIEYLKFKISRYCNL